jgi:hypothetical protein
VFVQLTAMGWTCGCKIELDFPYEFVTGVSGGSVPVLRSLTFTTSRGKVHGPFGYDDGTPFAYRMEGGVVVGFTGRSSWRVDALGLYVAALRPETICDAVQERGLTAWHGSSSTGRRRGSSSTRPRGRSSGATNEARGHAGRPGSAEPYSTLRLCHDVMSERHLVYSVV